MNQPDLNSRLDSESSRLRRYALFGIFGVLLGGVLVVGALLATCGTRIEVAPRAARETAVVRVSRGFGLYLSGAVYSLGPAPDVSVSAQGYESKTEPIPPNAMGKTHRMELREVPAMLTVDTSPSRAETAWVLDGHVIGVGPRLEKELSSGEYVVEIDNPFFALHTENISLVRQQKKHMTVSLQPIDGVLALNSVPPRAVVKINGKEVGHTPFQAHFKGATYTVEVGDGDHIPARDTIRLTRDTPQQSRTYRLEVKKGYVTVHVSPGGGKLLLNGIKVDPNVRLALDAGHPAMLTYAKAGYFSKTVSVSLAPREEKQVSLALTVETGVVDFRSTPSADVFIKGKKIGQTPFKKTLRSIPYDVVFRKAGYRSLSKKVRPTSTSPQLVQVTLKPELAARLSEAAKDYVNSIGMRLKLFEPRGTLFDMGAPRSEKGQRANEIVRKIILKKPFYASIHEVTNQQFRTFAATAGTGAATLPVTNVDWSDAARFCNWLSRQENLTPFYEIGRSVSFNSTADGYRLLSEAEWEWLARKAGKPLQTRFSWGNDPVIPPKAGNIADESAKGHVRFYVSRYTDGFSGVAPVGSFAIEPSGLFDLGGNVREWVHDVYVIVPSGHSGVETDPLGEATGKTHTIKGASWQSGRLSELRAAFREGGAGGQSDVGFRVGRYLYGGEK